MTPKQRYKNKIKEIVRLSNEAVANGLPADPRVVELRKKNNATKANWKAKQPPKERKPRKYNSGCFKIGRRASKKTEEEKAASLKKWRENSRQWGKNNKARVNAKRRERRKNDPSFKMQCNMRKRLSFLLRKSIVGKTEQTMQLLGCTMEEFKKHLQSKFTEGMTFENYGQWHIDHKIPCSKFDLSKKEDREICFHYSNLQPLWALDNRIKSNRLLAA